MLSMRFAYPIINTLVTAYILRRRQDIFLESRIVPFRTNARLTQVSAQGRYRCALTDNAFSEGLLCQRLLWIYAAIPDSDLPAI